MDHKLDQQQLNLASCLRSLESCGNHRIVRPRAWIAALLLVFGAAAAQAEPGAVRLIMPPALYAAPGIEANLYFENVVLVVNPANYAFDVDCEKGIQQAERWTFTPTADDAGTFPLTLRVRDGANTIIAEGTTSLVVAPAGAGKGQPVSMLLIGDSLTHASIYSQTLLDHAATPEAPALTLVGSHAPKDDPANRHEGYGGWTAARFATHYTDAPRDAPYLERPSPFVYKDEAGAIGLDFARYCAENLGGAPPDVVTIFLGCNDTFGAVDETIEATIDTMFAHMDALIAMIHGLHPETRIGLIAPVPPAASQDAFGANYKNGQTRWQYLRNQHRVVERMSATYGGREPEHISLIPAYVNLDCHRNYAAAAEPANAQTETAIPRQNNGVHPDAPGYRQIGDSIYAWLLAGLAG